MVHYNFRWISLISPMTITKDIVKNVYVVCEAAHYGADVRLHGYLRLLSQTVAHGATKVKKIIPEIIPTSVFVRLSLQYQTAVLALT